MRVLAIPMCSSVGNIRSESDYRIYEDIVLQTKDKDIFWYLVLPKGHGLKDGELGPKCKIVEGDKIVDFYRQQMQLDGCVPELFGENGQYQVDGILTSRIGYGTMMRQRFYSKMLGESLFPVMVIEPKVSDFKVTHNTVEREELLIRSMSYTMAYTLFGTPREKDLAINCAKRFLTPSLLVEIDKRSRPFALWVDTDELDEAKARVGKRDKYTLFFGGRLNTNKRWDEILVFYEKFKAFGRNVDIVVCAPLGTGGGVVGNLKEVKFHQNLPRKEYVDLLVSCHQCMMFSDEEAFTIGCIEQLYSGQIMILRKREWVKGLILDMWDWYPFLVDNADQAQAMIRQIHEDYAGAQKKMEKVREFIKEKFSIGARMADLCGEMQKRFVDENDLLVSDGVKELVAKSIVGKDIIRFSELQEKMRENADAKSAMFHDGSSRFTVTKAAVYRYMRKVYKDTCVEEEPVFMLK